MPQVYAVNATCSVARLLWVAGGVALCLSCDRAGQPEPDIKPQACRDPVIIARYDACRKFTDQESCVKAGGSWQPYGGSMTMSCACPTGEVGCPCSSGEECVAGCTAEPLGTATTPTCAEVTRYECARVFPEPGCRCKIRKDPSDVVILCTN
jgi:hypothetical protein